MNSISSNSDIGSRFIVVVVREKLKAAGCVWTTASAVDDGGGYRDAVAAAAAR